VTTAKVLFMVGMFLVGLVIGQINLVPINPADAISAQHQVRQDAAIESLSLQHQELAGRVLRVEKVQDGILVAMVGMILTQLYSQHQTRRRNRRI
jgi:hypothetical protein